MKRSRHRSHVPDDDIKYAPGVGARVPPSQRPLSVLERVTLTHVEIFLVATTWAFGGQADWVVTPLAWWGSIGVLLTLTAVQDRDAWRDGWMRPLIWLWPFVAFNVIVLLACLNPSFRSMQSGAEAVLVHEGGRAGLLSSARPALALKALWIFDGAWIACFNLALILRQRRAVRLLLIIAVANALALALFGSAQKFTGASGLYFGTVASPQTHFFSTFVYHNHWGAFMVLMIATGIGLVWHYGRRRDARDFFHTPAFAGIIVVLVLAVTVPLSLSRSCTALAVVLLGAALIHGCAQIVKRRRQFRESPALPLAGAAVGVALASVAIWFVAGESITQRLTKTEEQIAEMRARGGIGDRATLYRDTWEMAKAKPWFGWGMGSYPHVFTLYNTQKSVDRLPVFYHDAHSDWLQAFAEHGIIGSLLLGLCALVPLLRLRPRHLTSPVPAYLLGGCALIVLYAWVEFPFGNVAVVLSWWLCFFSGVQYARLQDREAMAPAKKSSSNCTIAPTADCATATC